MSEEHVHRSLLSRAGWFLAFIPLGVISILLVVSPFRSGTGYVSLALPVCIVTWIVVGVASMLGFAGCCPRLSWFALVGWLTGQGAMLWHLTPTGSSPSRIVELIDTAQAGLYAMVIVALLNWPVAPAFIIGRIVKHVRERNSAAKALSPATPEAK